MRFHSELVIHLDLLAYNVEQLKKLAPNNQIIFMVKADAYGHGLIDIVSYSYNNLGIKSFGVASLDEAVTIRDTFPHFKCEVYVFSDVELMDPNYKHYYCDLNITPMVSHIDDFKMVLNDDNFKTMPLALMFDTGMNRLGLSPDDIDYIVSELKAKNRVELYHLCTHFAQSYIPARKGDKTSRQLEVFQKLKTIFRDNGISIKGTSCSNSGAIEQQIGLEETHIRPGLMLYGPKSNDRGSTWEGKVISTLKAQVINIIPVKKGMPIGYGGHVCSKDGHVAYVSLGYGDGILSYYSGAKLDFFGEQGQILGRVNMDMTAIFFENLPVEISRGITLDIWNQYANLDELAVQSKSIPYQIFTSITARVPRRYIN